MKKVFALVLSMLVVVSSVTAMDFKYGGKMDIGGNTVVGNNIVKLNPQLSFAMGGELDLGITENISIVPELSIRVMNGFKQVDNNGDSQEWNWMVFEIPVIFQYKLPLKVGKVVFEVGPSFDIGFGDVTMNQNIGGHETLFGGSFDDVGLTKTVIAGIAGVGYQLDLSGSAMTIGGRLKYDITSIDATNTADMHRFAFLLNVAFVKGF